MRQGGPVPDGQFDGIGLVGFVGELVGCNPGVQLTQHLVGRAVAFGKVVEVDILSAQFLRLCRQGGVEVAGSKEETVLLRVLHYLLDGQNAVDVARGLVVETRVVVAGNALAFHITLQAVLPTIVGCRSRCPAAELAVKRLKVLASRFGSCLHVVAHIDLIVDFQPVFLAGSLDKLPEALCLGRRCGICQAAFNNAKVFEVGWNAVLFQNGFDYGEKAMGTFKVEQSTGMAEGVDNHFTVKAFAYIVYVQRHGFACKRHRVGKRRRIDARVCVDALQAVIRTYGFLGVVLVNGADKDKQHKRDARKD